MSIVLITGEMFPKRFYTADEDARAKAFDMFPSLEVALDALTCIEAEVIICILNPRKYTSSVCTFIHSTYIIDHLLTIIIIVVVFLFQSPRVAVKLIFDRMRDWYTHLLISLYDSVCSLHTNMHRYICTHTSLL